jgi:sugar transferase (PEP-CTERM system associated)
MTRVFGHFVPLEMIGLWLIEFPPCLLAVYVLLTPVGGTHFLDIPTLQHAAVITLALSATWTSIGLYRPEIVLETRRLFISTAAGAVLGLPVLWLVSTIFGGDTTFLVGGSMLRPVQFVITWIALLFATRLALRMALRFDILARRILVVGSPADAARTRAAIERMRAGFFTLAGTAAPDDAAALAPAALARRGIWAVVVTEEARGALPQEELMRGKHAGIHVFSDVEFREQQLRRIDLAHLAPDWMIFAPGLSRGPVEAAIRRGFDLALSLAMLIFTLPLMALTALVIRLDSPGPALYCQQRVGLQGRVFTLFKFRSMRTDAEAEGPAWAAQDDSRVTRIGNFLRRTRIDELPQLFNVLKGEMSFVGPRPERPHFVTRLAAEIPFYNDRSAVKPGISGWAQVNYPYGASTEDARQKLSYDLYYIKRRSLFLDLLILVATVRVILFREGSR